jgi:hypothetical protein
VSATKILWGQITIVVLIVLATMWAATQWTAWRLGFQPQLGQPWFQIVPGLPVYLPPAFFWWWYAYDAYAPGIFLEGACIAASGGLLSVAVATSQPVRPDDWSSLPLRSPSAALLAEIDRTEDATNSGLRREPELPDHLAVAKETTVSPPGKEFAVTDGADDSVPQARVLGQQMRRVARQAALDPGDGLGL